MRGIVIYILLIINVAVVGQKSAELFVSNDFANGEGIQVKLLYQYVYHPEGFNIHRKEVGGAWKKINSDPIKIKNSATGYNLNKEENDLYTATLKANYEEFKGSVVRAFVLIKAITNNDMAECLGMTYHDITAQKGKTYQYKIETAGGEEIAVSKEIVCNVYEKVLPPTDIILTRKKKYITLNWKPDIYRYYGVNVYRKNNSSGEYEKLTFEGPVALTPEDEKTYSERSVYFVDTNIVYDDSYVYKLVAIDYFGQESEMSEEIAAPAKDFIPPQMPFGFKLTPSSTRSEVKLVWETIEESDLAGFNIYVSEDPDAEFTKVNGELIDKMSRDYVHKNVPVGGYYYIVSSVDYAGNETMSGMMFTELFDRTPPEAPKNFVATPESGTITLTWEANAESDLKGYFIQKSLNDSNNLDNSYINVNAKPITETTYSEKIPKNVRNKFVYRVVAVDTSFNRSKPSANSLAQMPDVVPPMSPVISNLKLEDDNIQVSWLLNADLDLAGYNLFRNIEGDSTSFKKVNINLIPSNVSSYTDRNIEKGVEYSYQLEAVDNSDNKSGLSKEFKILIPKPQKEIVLEIEKSSYNDKKQQVLIQWYKPEGIEMRGYVVYMLDEGGAMKPVTGLSEYTEYKTKTDLSSTYAEYEIRGYTMEGEVIKTNRIAINKN